ncbi:tRNA dimethylallyltransferase, mitochondrial [Linderina macrospora]|uniref:tRNA dimethylallyltransferase, mitochondrial n=1 Tax=Linderina macrospora TaxID=4868 RepID=A0ACC1JE78_9FUNG|nr:tRNA dimethylallyltransferase, mitochondrial [Linderina macrospora]
MSLLRNGLIAITGTTGVGKSQLAIEIARAINGEVINADALQVYHGYPIITNKVTDAEMLGVPHHLLGTVGPSTEYTVQDFERDALLKINEIHQRDRVPVLVGGTNYYIQSAMFRTALVSSISRDSEEPQGEVEREFETSMAAKTNQQLWEELKAADPPMAEKWHVNNRRKVLRSLEILHTTGKKHSVWVEESEMARKSADTLRFPTLLFWLYADTPVLNTRLDNRVDDMIKRGMFGELQELHRDMQNPDTLAPLGDDFTKGLTQAIGFREFKPYLDAQTSDDSEKLKAQGIENMKRATRRYAKRQITWIRNKLLPESNATLQKPTKAHAYVLDATDLKSWDANVKQKGIDIARLFMKSAELPDPKTLSGTAEKLLAEVKDKPNSILQWKRHRCDVCSKSKDESRSGEPYEVWLNGDDEYTQHMRSRQHKKNLKYKKRLAEAGDIQRKRIKTAGTDQESDH